MKSADKQIMQFTVLHEGWEADNEAWIMERADGSRYLMMTSHERPYEADITELQKKIDEYKRVMHQSERAMLLLGGAT